MNNPIPAVRLAVDCTLSYLGVNKSDWSTAQKVLADMRFLDKLRNYDKDNISEKVLTNIKNHTNNPDFDLARMTRASKAAGGLAKWCVSLRQYAEQCKVVKPLIAQ